MYNYEISNNHIIVNIQNQKFLLDTGSPVSFSFKPPISLLNIDGTHHSLIPYGIPNAHKVFALIGKEVDGFIGLDIISKTSLTIYKDGRIDFKATSITGHSCALDTNFPLRIPTKCGNYEGYYVIDTGAMVGYGLPHLFNGLTPYVQNVYDYNPGLGDLYNDLYHLDVEINGNKKTIDAFHNKQVERHLYGTNSLMIGPIHPFFDEVCVIDMDNRVLITK